MKEHLQKVVEETIKSPLLQIKWQELIMAAGKPSEEGGGGGKTEEKKPVKIKKAEGANSLPPF